jgi:hypothetical protein
VLAQIGADGDMRRALIRVTLALSGCLACGHIQAQPTDSAALVPEASPFNEERILGVMPDYQTVRDPGSRPLPLTVRQKWDLAFMETIDPFNIASAAMSAGFSQMGNQTPSYGDGMEAYGMRLGAAQADCATQNFFSAGLLASVLHQDPRYYRRGPEYSVVGRVFYALSRLGVARMDSGKESFNASGVLGMALGIAASNAYYPSTSRRGDVMAGRLTTSLTSGVIGNLMSEFWPDIQTKFFRKRHHG